MGRFVHLATADSFDPAPGITGRALFGDRLMLAMFELEAAASVPLHSHPHEQAGFVLAGELFLTVEGVEHRLGAEDAYQIPGGVDHSARAGPNGSRILEIFTPVREDLRALLQSRPS